MKSKKIRDRLSALQGIVIFDKEFFDELNELERLARVGEATEKAYDGGYDLNVNVHPARHRFKNIQSLLEWAESEGK